jgi:hypothetical protein
MDKDEVDAILDALAEEKRMALEEASRMTGKSVEELMEQQKNMDPDRKEAFDTIYDVIEQCGPFGVTLLEKFMKFYEEKGFKGIVKPNRPEIDAMIILTYAGASIARELAKEIARHPEGCEEMGFDSWMNMARDLYIYAAAIGSAVERAKMMKEMEEDNDAGEGLQEA